MYGDYMRTFLKKYIQLFTFISLTLWCSVTFSQEWKSIIKMKTGDEFFIDLSSKYINKNFVVVTVLNNYGLPDPFNKSKSSIQEMAFDCKNMKFQLLNDKFFSKQMGKGKILQAFNSPMPVMPMPKGSAWHLKNKKVC